MKKYLSVLIAVLLLCSMLAACDTASEPAGGQLDPAPATQGNVGSDSGEPIASTDGNQSAEQTDATQPADDTPVSLGRMEGGIYTNSYAGYGVTLDTNWAFLTAEELQELPENAAEMFEGTAVGDSMEKYTQITDVMAENVMDMTSFNVLYQKLDLTTRLAYAVLTEEQVIDETLKQMDDLVSSYAAAGIQVSNIEKVKVNFLGEERTAMLTTATTEGIPYYALQIMDFHLGSYSVTLTLSSYEENKTESLLDLFYAVD